VLDESQFATLADEEGEIDETEVTDQDLGVKASEKSVREQQQKLLSEAAALTLTEAVQSTLQGECPVVVGDGGLPKKEGERKLVNKQLYELKCMCSDASEIYLLFYLFIIILNLFILFIYLFYFIILLFYQLFLLALFIIYYLFIYSFIYLFI
jgi:hypothetical protein